MVILVLLHFGSFSMIMNYSFCLLIGQLIKSDCVERSPLFWFARENFRTAFFLKIRTESRQTKSRQTDTGQNRDKQNPDRQIPDRKYGHWKQFSRKFGQKRVGHGQCYPPKFGFSWQYEGLVDNFLTFWNFKNGHFW